MEIDRTQIPLFLSDYLTYLDVIRGKAKRTVTEYYNDICLFLRWLHCRNLKQPVSEAGETEIADMPFSELEAVTVSVLYDYIR